MYEIASAKLKYFTSMIWIVNEDLHIFDQFRHITEIYDKLQYSYYPVVIVSNVTDEHDFWMHWYGFNLLMHVSFTARFIDFSMFFFLNVHMWIDRGVTLLIKFSSYILAPPVSPDHLLAIFVKSLTCI